MNRGFTRIYHFLSARRVSVLILFLLILALAGFLTRKVSLEEDLTAVIPADERLSSIGDVFDRSAAADQLVFMISSPERDPAGADSGPDLLIRAGDSLSVHLREKSELIAGLTFRTREDALMKSYELLYRNLPLFLDEEDYSEIEKRLTREGIEQTIAADFRALLSPTGFAAGKFIPRDPLNLTPLALEKLSRFRLDDNFTLYNSCIFTLDRQYLMLFLEPSHPSSDTRTNLELVRFIDQSIEATMESLPGVDIRYYGGTAVAVANSVRVKKDIKLTVALALLFFLVIFLLFFRRIGTILLLFLPVLVGAVFSIAILAQIYGELSAIAMGVGVIIIGISVDYSLHLLTHIRSGNPPEKAVGQIARPVLMSSMTTASAFLCLMVVQSEALNQVGLFAAIAVVVSALCVLLIVPLLMRRQEDYGWKAAGPGHRLESWLNRSFEKNRILVVLIMVSSLFFAWSSGKIRFNGDISTLNYMSPELQEAEDQLNSISSVANSSIYLVTRGTTMEEALLKLETGKPLLNGAMQDGLINEISSVGDLLMSVDRQEEKIRTWNRFWEEAGKERIIRDIRESGRKYHFKAGAFEPFFTLLHREFSPVPAEEFDLLRELFLDQFIAEDEEGVALISVIMALPGNKAELFERFALHEDFIIFDTQYFINRFFEVLKDDFSKLVKISMIVVFLILLLFFGRLELALVSFIPILLSWMWTLGLMGLFQIEINIFNIIISTFVFGLGIDYCIFITNGLLAAYREGGHPLGSYRLSVLLSAMTTVTAIGVLVFAQHPALKSIAFVSIFGISTVVLISYTILPLLFNWLVYKKDGERIFPITLVNLLYSIVYFLLFLGTALVVTLILPLILLLPAGRPLKKRFMTGAIHGFSRAIVVLGFFIRKKRINPELADLSRPSVIIANHQSQLDLMLMLQLHPKMIVLVNKWVWNNPFYGALIRYADYYPVYKGLDHNFNLLKQKVREGYSILAFPEASRSPDGSIKRFHQGALGIADMLDLEVTPVMIHGAYDVLPKKEHLLKPGTFTLKFFPPFRPRAVEYDGIKSYKEQARELTAFYRKEYRRLREQAETPAYFRRRLMARYLYKGPVLEHYLKIKLRMEKDYRFFNELIPRDAVVADLGCGYGFLTHMLALVSAERKIVGLDYDGHKIAVAAKAGIHLDNLEFRETDLTRGDLPHAGVYILNDVLHYLDRDRQLELLEKCLRKISSSKENMLIFRDADASLEKRNRFTRFTEFQSTRVFGFNKTTSPLVYLESREYEDVIVKAGCRFERFDLSRRTSNVIYVVRG